MNIEKNRFEERPADSKPGPMFIQFNIGEPFTLKGYMFVIDEINVSKNSMVLKPVGIGKHIRRSGDHG